MGLKAMAPVPGWDIFNLNPSNNGRKSLFCRKVVDMDIQATKLELMQLLLNTQQEQILTRIKQVFEEEELDLWHTLNTEDQQAIEERIKQLISDEFIPEEALKKKSKTTLT